MKVAALLLALVGSSSAVRIVRSLSLEPDDASYIAAVAQTVWSRGPGCCPTQPMVHAPHCPTQPTVHCPTQPTVLAQTVWTSRAVLLHSHSHCLLLLLLLPL